MPTDKRPSSGVIFLQRVRDDKISMARELRKKMTTAELKMWEALRGSRCAGLKFRRQQVIAGYIVDFFCHSANLVVEIDGPVHDTIENREYDQQRKEVFETRGLKELRFTNEQVIGGKENVLETIKKVAVENKRAF